MNAATGGLGGIKREIGVADEGVGAGTARVADRNPDRRADGHLVALDHVGARNLLDQGLGKRFQQAGFDSAGKHRLKLVAAKPTHLPMIAHHQFQALGNLAEQPVADGMAEGIVDVLEPIEIDQEQRAALLPDRGVSKRLV